MIASECVIMNANVSYGVRNTVVRPMSAAPSSAGGFGGSQHATPTFCAKPQTSEQQQQQCNMFNIGAGPAQPPKGRTIARARRTHQ